MSYCGSFPGMCGRSPECADIFCEGHPANSGLWQRCGGLRISGDDSLRLDPRRCSTCVQAGNQMCSSHLACHIPEPEPTPVSLYQRIAAALRANLREWRLKRWKAQRLAAIKRDPSLF